MVLLAIALLTTQPEYKLVESFPLNNETLIGSPLADTFYIERRRYPYSPAKDESKAGVQVFEKSPGREPKLLKAFADSPALLGTDAEGRPVYQTSFVKTTTIGREPQFYDDYEYRAYSMDSGTIIEYKGSLSTILTGPQRDSKVVRFPSGMSDDPSVAIISSRPRLLSSDGRDHLITLNVDDAENPQNLILTLLRWGNTINTLETVANYTVPCFDGKESFHITALASAKESLCYIALETWTRTDTGFADKAKRQILAVDVVKKTKTTLATFEIGGPQSQPESSMRTQPVELSTIQGGKFLAVSQEGKVSIYQRQ